MRLSPGRLSPKRFFRLSRSLRAWPPVQQIMYIRWIPFCKWVGFYSPRRVLLNSKDCGIKTISQIQRIVSAPRGVRFLRIIVKSRIGARGPKESQRLGRLIESGYRQGWDP